ncbi:uncharacterized protein LOC121375748 [Gigantopelta aegis]|uniref:uncharacterized protein LOC121375748 n=1 Tax=Gigantopelta aegis TaxID=1735272 RepID=UPI001B88954F|nr:uncharacterized protein LOC121375748 [Gigantopelta aegis]
MMQVGSTSIGIFMLKIQDIKTSNTSKYKFRQLSRDVSGEGFDIPEGNHALFAYYNIHKINLHIGGVTFSLANLNQTYTESTFECDYFHQITFMFVKRDYQGKGYGTQLINGVIEKMTAHASHRPVRVQSAVKAVGFFEKMGFVKIGEPMDTLACGPHLFRTIVNMEKQLSVLPK